MPPLGELTLDGPVEDDRVEDHAAGHVRAVESGEGEEDAGEDPIARQESELRVLVALADEEENAEHDRRDEPVAKPAAVAALDGVRGELHGHARDEQLDRVERGKADAEDRVDLPRRLLTEHGLPLRDPGAEEEVRSEERAEEERLARDEQDDGPHARGEPRGLRLEAGLVRRKAIGRVAAAAAHDRPILERGP